MLGAGAIGAYVGAALARGGSDVHLIARGPHLAAMRRDGVRIVDADGSWVERPACTDDPREIGPVDVVFLGLKAHAYASAGPLLAPLLGADTAVVAAQNGVPWWYFHRHGGRFDGRRIEALDPEGAVTRAIPLDRVIGSVVYPATEIEAPGVIRHVEGRRIAIGEPDRSVSPRCEAIRDALVAGGLKCPIDPDLRAQIWLKLMGNAAFNPLSALTGATMRQIAEDPGAYALAGRIMREVEAVAAALGAAPRVDVGRRLAGAAAVGDHKTSMLQDREAGRPLELDALAGAVLELAALVGVDAPALAAVTAALGLLMHFV